MAKIKGQLAGVFSTDTDLFLNITQVASAIFDINAIIRPSQYFYFSWQAMTILRHTLFYFNLRSETEEEVDTTKRMTFVLGALLPALTLNIPYVAFHISTSQAVVYGSQLQYGVKEEEEPMKFYAGLFLSSIRISLKLNNPTTNVIATKLLDIGFAAVAAYCLKDFSFKYWKKEDKIVK